MTSITYTKPSGTFPVRIESASFQPDIQVGEWHLILHTTAVCQHFKEQLQALTEAFQAYKESELPEQCEVLFARCFVSDAANQTSLIRETWDGLYRGKEYKAPLSIVQQPPLDGSKLSFWIYLSTPMTKHYTPFFGASLTASSGDSETQMRQILEAYEKDLAEKGCTLELNCLRTWIYVRDVDVNYAGVVKGRTENFSEQGLTPETHFIASTGIQGQTANPQELVVMDAYAVKGLKREQIQFLYAPTHLNPTYEYKVTFERGVCISYGDRQHVWISGTASINNKGEIVHPGDIRLQTHRMWENVEALLHEADCTCRDLAHILVYLRDPADYTMVKSLFESQFPQVPTVYLLAPVCRPGWLVEMECMAVKAHCHPEFPAL